MAAESPPTDDQTGTPSNIVEALNVRKLPPPETADSIWTRRQVILSFWAVVLFLGLPIWWKTTAIYRANLPLQDMGDWADGKVCRPVFPLRIAVKAPSLSLSEAQHLLKTTQHALDDLNEFSAHHLRLILPDPSQRPNASQAVTVSLDLDNSLYDEQDDDVALSVRLIPGSAADKNSAELQAYSKTLNVVYLLNQISSTSSTSSPLATFIANELQKVFAEEQASLAYLLSSAASQTPPPKTLSAEMADTLSRRQTRSFRYAPTYHLTFSLFTPEATPSAWEIESALEEYLAPLLDSLSLISNFTVDTQVQLYSKFSPSIAKPKWDEGQKAWTLRKEDLSGFINAAEWPLSPSIGEGPTVNFVLYVPSANQSPLVIETTGSNSWLVPQWGSVYILNPSSLSHQPPNTKLLTTDAMQPAMMSFSSQLLSLLGLPETPRSLPLRISTLTRVRAASLIFSASSTLGALARLTVTLPSISIPDSVANSVDLTIKHLHRACNELREGRFQSALSSARVAEGEAEKAFFERSMVGQVYFPDEHKVAVYLPLLGPVAVPLLMAALKEVKKMREKKSTAA